MINLVNKQVVHDSFGKGKIVNCNDSHVRVNFESGDKRFVFPDAFGEYLTLVDEMAASQVREKKEKKEKELREIALKLKEKRAKERERREILERQRAINSRKGHSELQSVFWAKDEEQEEIFQDWSIFTGSIKSGKNKGQPRRLARMNKNSACLITERNGDMSEDSRRILGVFMADETFIGRDSIDGYIPSHPEYRIRLSEEEADKMLFWNYYFNKSHPQSIVWNSGRQRYFDNKWMAQILRDIINLKEDPKEQEHVKEFFKYFCRINGINKDELEKPNGALVQA